MVIGLWLQTVVVLGGADPAPFDPMVVDLVPRVIATTTLAESVTSRRLDGSVDWGRSMGPMPVDQDTLRTRRRGQSIEYSGFYNTRLTVHRYLSFAMLPLFAGSFLTGDQIIRKAEAAPEWARDWHAPFATATAVVFTLNTITGLWNLWDSRKNPAGRTRRIVHGLLFMVANAGFTYAGTTLAEQAEEDPSKRNLHRTVALSSMGVSVASWGLMLLTK